MRSYPFQVVMRRFTLLIIPSRHGYLADNDSSFVLFVYSALKLACQGLTKSETHTAAIFVPSSQFSLLVSGLNIWFWISKSHLYRNCIARRWRDVCNMGMKGTKWYLRSGNVAVGTVTNHSFGQPRNNGSIPRGTKDLSHIQVREEYPICVVTKHN